MISFVLPTRDRPDRLARTLDALGAIGELDGAEVIVADNASRRAPRVPRRLANGAAVDVVRLDHNAGAAARNHATERASGEWIVMLDDDSWPLDDGIVEVLATAPAEVAAIGAEIVLPDGTHEAGGLPEVIVGCGAALRREAFVAVGGYDASFGYYAEEYDLCARLLAAGHRVVHDVRFRVEHAKVAAGRDMNRIVRHLVRNNAWVMQRYAPDDDLGEMLAETIDRYGRMALAEQAGNGFRAGLADVLETLDAQPRTPLARDAFDRFTGLTHARAGIRAAGPAPGMAVALTDAGKNAWAVRRALDEAGIEIRGDAPDALVVATLSPGPVLDAQRRRRSSALPVLALWSPSAGPHG